jgi:hypothetical protein
LLQPSSAFTDPILSIPDLKQSVDQSNATTSDGENAFLRRRERAEAMGLVTIFPKRSIGTFQLQLAQSIMLPEFDETIDVQSLQRKYGVSASRGSDSGSGGFSGIYPPRNSNPVILYPLASVYRGERSVPAAYGWMFADDVQSVHGWRPSVQILTPVVQQYICGCCWAVSVTTALADRAAIWRREPVRAVSWTSILSCVGMESEIGGVMLDAPLTAGCSGGVPLSAVEMCALDGVVMTECPQANYDWCSKASDCLSPYTDPTTLNHLLPACADVRTPQCDRISVATYDNGRVFRLLTDRTSIQMEILLNGPVVATYAVYEDFLAGTADRLGDGWAKTNGVYCNVQTRGGPRPYNGTRYAGSETVLTGYHAVVLCGWGTERVPDWRAEGATVDVPFWIVRNSWGVKWNPGCVVNGVALPGYCKIAMSDSALGVNTQLFMDYASNGAVGATLAFQPLMQRIGGGSDQWEDMAMAVTMPRALSSRMTRKTWCYWNAEEMVVVITLSFALLASVGLLISGVHKRTKVRNSKL